MFGKLAGVLFLVMVCCGIVAAEEFGAMITKVDGDNVTFYKTQFKPGEKPQKGEATTLTAKNAKVYQGKIHFNKEEKKGAIVPGDAIEGGLKNDVFKLVGKASIAARITTSDDNKSITRILSMKAGTKRDITLASEILTPKAPLPECPDGVVRFTLKVKVDASGEGQGRLLLDPTQRNFDEFGEVIGPTKSANIELDCSLKLVKPKTKRTRSVPSLHKWFVYEIHGKKISSRLFLVTTKDRKFSRLLTQDEDGEVTCVIQMREQTFVSCHPGCFPATTSVQTPKGAKPIDTLKAGDLVTTVRPNGETVPGKVQAVFVTHNQLVKVETEGGVLFTTQVQPLCLDDGQIRPAGELKAGDKIFCWQDGKRQSVTVRAALLTDREEKVFNLVLGGSEVFIAGGFLARSKPPADAVLSAQQTPLPGPASKK